MRNVYQRFVMRPATTQAMADRLRGAPGRVTGIAPNIQRSNAPEVFFKNALAARSMVEGQSGVYPLGANGGLAGLGAVDGKFPVVGNIGFNEAWSFEDWEGKSGWVNHIRYWKLATYEPLDPMVLGRAQQKWDALYAAANAGSEQAYQLWEQMKTSLSNATDAVDRNTKTADGLGRYSDASHRERARLLTVLNGLLRSLANMSIPAPPAGGGGMTTLPPPGGSTGGGGGGMPFRPPMGSSAGAATSGGGPSMGMIALGAAVVLGAGVWLIKRKKS